MDDDDQAPSLYETGMTPPKRHLDPFHVAVRESLEQLRNVAYGGRGQVDLAKLMTRYARRPVSPVLLSHWLTGRYAMPAWAVEAMHGTAAQVVVHLRRRADIIERNVVPRIAAQVAAMETNEEPDPEEDDRPAPSM